MLNSGIQKLGSPTTSSYGIMHDKFVVIDANSTDANDAIVFNGSEDWSQEMVDSDYNNIIIFQDPPLAKAYTAQFNQMWGDTAATPVIANEKFGPFKADLGPHTFTIGGSTVELYFSPTDGTNAQILNVINSADSQLYFGVFTFTETNDANAIVARKNAGVYTAGVVDQYSYTFSATPILIAGLGNMVKEYAQSRSLYHNKYLVVDPCNTASDPQVLTGSHNWTTSADTKNDENTVIIHDADVANIYYQAISQDFNSLGGTQLTPCPASTGIDDLGADNLIKIYPNPLSSGNWQLEVTSDWIGSSCDIYDAGGKQVMHTTVSNFKTELPLNISEGVYLIKITESERSIFRKLIRL